MAKQKGNASTDNDVNDLLDGNNAAENQAADGQAAAPATDKRSKEEIDAEIKATQERIKALRAEAKGEKVKVPRVLKGKMVTFRNKSGAQITGLGQLYYVTRMDGKLYYKEASQVVELPADWKEGDALPALPSDEVSA